MPDNSEKANATRSSEAFDETALVGDYGIVTGARGRSRKAELPPEGVDPVKWRKERKEQLKAKRRSILLKANEQLRLKREQQKLVRQKVEQGLPITEEERQLLSWSRAESKKHREKRLLDEVASLVIKPQTVNELRLVVEKTAARYGYNPIEALIKLTTEDSGLEDKEKVSIHKALLPFLAPQLPTPKTTKETEGGGKVKVTVTQFVFPEEKRVEPLHKERPGGIVDTEVSDA